MLLSKKINIVILISGFLIASGPQGFAAPAITNVSGSLTHGSSVTITGSGFGTKSTATPWRWDPIEGISAYNGLTSGSTIPSGVGKYWDHDNSNMKYNTTASEQRGVSTANVKTTGASSCPAEENKKLACTAPSSRSRYVSYWIYYTTTMTNQNSKTMRIWAARSDTSNKFSLEPSWTTNGPWTAYRVVNNDQYKWQAGVLSGGFERPIGGKWERFELFLEHESDGPTNAANDGSIRVRQTILDGSNSRIHEYFKTAQNMDEPGFPTTLNWITFGFDRNCTGTDIDENIRLDDIYIDNTQARVELCDKSTWSTNTHCEVQIPQAWSSNSITAKLNQGAFSNLTNVYMYVIDANGNVNTNGFLISGSAPSSPVPMPPMLK